MGFYTHANVMPHRVLGQALSIASAQPLTVPLEGPHDFPRTAVRTGRGPGCWYRW